jgi:hypothetical protein
MATEQDKRGDVVAFVSQKGGVGSRPILALTTLNQP